MTHVLLVGREVALLEGLAQSLAALGHEPAVATSLAEAHDQALLDPPLVLVVSRSLASNAGADLLAIPIAAGGARLLYRAAAVPLAARAASARCARPVARRAGTHHGPNAPSHAARHTRLGRTVQELFGTWLIYNRERGARFLAPLGPAHYLSIAGQLSLVAISSKLRPR
jgi:hypothetical protein